MLYYFKNTHIHTQLKANRIDCRAFLAGRSVVLQADFIAHDEFRFIENVLTRQRRLQLRTHTDRERERERERETEREREMRERQHNQPTPQTIISKDITYLNISTLSRAFHYFISRNDHDADTSRVTGQRQQQLHDAVAR